MSSYLLDILFVPHKIPQKVLRNGSLPIPHPQVRRLWGVANLCVLWYNEEMIADTTQTQTEKIPQFVAPFLWSYDIWALDLEWDK